MATGSPNREFTSEELDAMAAAELPVENPETSRTASAAPVASAPTAPEATGSPELAVGDGTSFSMQEPPRGPAMGPVAKLEAGREYSTEELDLIEQANKPKEYTADQLDKSLVSTVFDDPTYIPTRDEYFEAKQLKARLKSEGKIPGLLEDAATGAQGFLQTIGDTIHEISDDPGEFLARSPATMKATAKKSWRNTNDVTRWIRQTNAPTPIGRDEQTGEFVFGQSGAGRSDAEVLAGQQQAAAGQGRSIRAVTEEDLKDEEFDRFVMERSRQKELEEWVASTTAPTEFVTRLVTGRNQTEQPMQATSELAGGLLEPTNIATMGVPLSAGAKTLGLSRLTKAGGATAARVLDRAAAKGIAGMETGAAKFQEIIQKGTKISPENQIKMAKWSAAGGIGGGVFGLDSDIPGVAQAQDAAKFIGGAYLGYKAGLGVLRTVQKISGSTATILRVASDAGEGFDDIAQASVATKLEAFPELSLVREALENPTRFRPIESTPARLAADPRLGKQTRAIADALASPAIVQGVRGTSAVATGAVKGAVANAPFVALALNADEDKAAANMFGMGVGFGAVGGAAGRFTGLEQRRTESRAFDTARMLMDVELAGGDVTKTIQTYSTQQLGDLAAMQGFFRDKVNFVPLGKADFDSNTQALGGAGAAGLHVQAAPGEKARVFVNLDAKRDGIVPHELGHALLKSGALGSAQADTIRSFTTRRYTQVGVEARGREYATAMIQNENAAKFPGQNFPVTPASISAKMDELGQSGLLRGDMDPLDWARDEIFAEDFRQASQSMDFAGIRRHLPADGSWLGSMENFLGAQANALSISGVRIDPVTGQPDPLFKANPILATDPVLKKQLDQYLNNYRNWINHPDQTKVRGVRVAPAGRASDLANNPQVTFHDYGNGVMANEFARMDPTTGQAVFREQRDITAETIKRQQQVKTLVGSKLIPATDPNLGPKKTADGRVTVRGRILPQKFDFLNGFAQHQRGFARQFETAAATGESMQVRYHSIGSGDTGAFQIKKLGNLEAITREIIPWGWELSGPNNLLASVLDLTQFRNRAIKAINAGEPNIGRLYNNDIKLIEADLKQWMDNHRNDLPGSNKIGEQRRDAINSLIGIGTNINKAANPFSGKIAGPSSAIKQFRLDRVDAAVGTGRQGFHFDYDKANNNLLPEIPTPLPDLSRDLPTDKGQAVPENTPTTGKPFEFFSIRNKEKSPFLGSRFGQDIEPHGKYMAESTPRASENLDARFEKGAVRFENPLVVDFGGGYGDSSNWKNVLSSQYEGKTGLELSQAIRDAGHDGIITMEPSKGPNRPAHTSEIVDIRNLQPQGQAMPDITITPDEAKRNGLVGPVYHGSPDFKGQKFDLKYRARNSGLSRGGFSFTDNVESAKGYASNKIDFTQSAVDSANDVMQELAGRMDSGLKVDGFADSTELPEFNSSYVDDIESLGNYFDEIANKIPKDLGDRLRVAASKTNEPANPVVVEAYLKNPKVTDINGKKLWLTDNPDDIFVSGTTRPPQGQAMPDAVPDAVPDKGIEMPAGSMTQLFTTAAKSLPKTIPQAKSVPSVRVMIREKVFDKKGQPVLDKKGNQKVKVTPKLRDNTEVKFKPGDFELPLPNFQIAKSKFSLGNKDLYGTAFKNKPQAISSISQIDKATSIIESDPLKFIDPKGYTEIMRDAGVTGNILVPPSGIAMMLNRPKDFIDLLNGGFHGPRTVSGTREAAMSGLDSVVEMRKVIGEKPTEFVTAMHHLWGTLSKQLPPLDQEALWMRLVVNPEVIEQIQNSIDGRFNLADTEWDRIVTNARDATQGRFEKLGNNATSNANSFHMMLEKHNGKWNQVADLYSAKNAIEMRSRFNALGHGATGIKNKVQGFIGLTFGIKGTVLDRWRFVDLYMDPVMQATGSPSHQHFFQYTGDAKRIPQDPIGIYGNYGTIENENPTFSLALYNSIDRASQAAINASPELKAYLGNHADPGGLHWVTWNAIKNEAVGHSSLDLTKNFLKKFGRTGTASDWVSFANSSKAYVEGQAANGREIIRLTLNNGVFDYSRQ